MSLVVVLIVIMALLLPPFTLIFSAVGVVISTAFENDKYKWAYFGVFGMVGLAIIMFSYSSLNYVGWIKLFFKGNHFQNWSMTAVLFESLLFTPLAINILGLGWLLDNRLLLDPYSREMRKQKASNLKNNLNLKGKNPKQRKALAHKKNEIFLGFGEKNKPVYFDFKRCNRGLFVVGSSGSGKTHSMMNLLTYCAENGIKTIIVNGKGSRDFRKNLNKVFDGEVISASLDSEGVGYDPFAFGSVADNVDKITQLVEFTEPFYKNTLIGVLNRVLKDGTTFLDFLNMEFKKEDRKGMENIISLIDRLKSANVFKGSEDKFNLRKNFKCVNFELHTLAQPELSRVFGKLILSDIKGLLSHQMGLEKKKPTMFLFEECGAYFGEVMLNIVNQGREGGGHFAITVQSLADLKKVNDNLFSQIISNCSTYLLHMINEPTEASYLAELVGTEKNLDFTIQVSDTEGTGVGSARNINQFVVHPDYLKQLKQGQAVLVKKSEGVTGVIPVQVALTI